MLPAPVFASCVGACVVGVEGDGVVVLDVDGEAGCLAVEPVADELLPFVLWFPLPPMDCV